MELANNKNEPDLEPTDYKLIHRCAEIIEKRNTELYNYEMNKLKYTHHYYRQLNESVLLIVLFMGSIVASIDVYLNFNEFSTRFFKIRNWSDNIVNKIDVYFSPPQDSYTLFRITQYAMKYGLLIPFSIGDLVPSMPGDSVCSEIVSPPLLLSPVKVEAHH